MSSVLPKEQQTAYQRWEMASFGDERPSAVKAKLDAAPPPVADLTILAEQIANAREDARRAGYAAGLESGLEAGRAAGLSEGRAEAAQELIHLQQISASFGSEVAQAHELIAEDMLNLSLDLAKAMLKTALTVRPELIMPIVGNAIRYLPTLQQPALLFLHPDDAILIRERMGEELDKAHWRVVEDGQMERGGCRVETASNQIDASLPTRWQRIAAALGKESDWIE